jgi:hypothetical protein
LPRGAPVISSDGQALLFSKDLDLAKEQFISLQATNSVTAPPSWATVVGQAYRITTNVPSLNGVSISFSYLGSEVPAGEEEGLRIYFWNEPAERWEMLTTTLNLLRNNASALARGPGLYALMSSIVLPIEHAGWNLVAYPAPGSQPMPAALASIAGYYTTVYGYDPSDPADPWKVYDAGVPQEWGPLVNDLHELRYGRGYWINVTQPITALLKGGSNITPTLLRAASQFSLPPATYYGLAPGAAAKAGLDVQARVNGTLCGQAQTQTLALAGQNSIVFTINVRAAGTGADAQCGTPGQPVTIAFLDNGRTIATLRTTWDNNRVRSLQDRAIYLPLVHH